MLLGTMFRRLSLLSPRLWASLPAAPAGGQPWASRSSCLGAWSGGAGPGSGLRSLNVASLAAASHSLPSVAHERRGSNTFVTRRGMATEVFERTKKHANIGSIGHVDHGALGAPLLTFSRGGLGCWAWLCRLLHLGVPGIGGTSS